MVLNLLEARANVFEEVHGFDPDNGWSQVANSPTDVKVEYGCYAELLDLIQIVTGPKGN